MNGLRSVIGWYPETPMVPFPLKVSALHLLDQGAADGTRSSTSFGTGRSVNPHTARRLMTASYTSMIAQLSYLLMPKERPRVCLHLYSMKSLDPLVIQQSLDWHERRSALVLDQDHQEFRRLGIA